jgi:hypothetical protein
MDVIILGATIVVGVGGALLAARFSLAAILGLMAPRARDQAASN